jgi:foldase protein PrsA
MKSKENIKKTPIHKKPLASKPKEEVHAVDKAEDSIELPISRMIIGVAVLLVIAAVVVGISPLWGEGNGWGFFQAQVKLNRILRGNTAAYVNGQAIPWSSINKKYASLSDSAKATITKEVLLNQTIMEMVIRQEVSKRGIQLDEAYVQAMINNIKSQFSDEKSFNDTLAKQGISYKEVLDQLTLSLKLNKMLQQDLPELRVNESEIEYYLEQVNASHILVGSLETAEEVEAKLESGADFAELAKNYSLDTASAVNGGELGYFRRGVMITEFESAAFNLRVGEISSPVKSKYGYHIIKVTGRKSAKEEMLNYESRALVELELFNNKWDLNREKVNSYLMAFRDSADIKLVK